MKKIVIIILTLCLCMFFTDYLVVAKNSKPYFAQHLLTYEDGGTREYFGPGYKIIIYNQLLDDHEQQPHPKFGTWFMPY